MSHALKKKRALLAISNKRKLMTLKTPDFITNSFFGSVMAGEYSMSFEAFLIVSASISLASMLLYYFVFKNALLTVGMAIPGFFVFYCLVSSSSTISNRLKYINDQRNFIEILESELTATNATLEAVKATAQHKLPKYLKTLMEGIVKRTQLGDSLEEIIEDVEEQAGSEDIKMAFAIIRINHKIGSSETLGGLREIAKNLEIRSDYVLSFKEKMSGQVIEKFMFYAISVYAPVLMEIYRTGYFSSLLKYAWGP